MPGATPFESLDAEAWSSVLDVNIVGGFNVARAVSPHFPAGQPSAMVLVSSIEASRVVAHANPDATFEYAASKSAVEALTRSLAFHLGPRGVRVNAVAPGPVDTPMTRGVHGTGLSRRFLDHMMIKRYAHPDEVAGPIAFLLSDAASYITASVIAVDGGYSAL